MFTIGGLLEPCGPGEVCAAKALEYPAERWIMLSSRHLSKLSRVYIKASSTIHHGEKAGHTRAISCNQI